MAGEYVIGIDCGTSAVKAAVWDKEGALLGLGRIGLEIQNPRPGWYEQDPGAWLTGVFGSIKTALREAEKTSAEHGRVFRTDGVGGICFSHQRETFVPVGESPLSNALLWMDERAGSLLDDLKTRISPDSFRAITGKPLSANLSVAKIEWLKGNKPRVFESAEMFHDVQSYVLKALTGRGVTGSGSADPTGLFDMMTGTWSAEILGILGLDEGKLPEVMKPGSIAGTLLPAPAEECGLPPGVPVIIGIGDGQSAGLGCGIAGPGESYLSLGTSIVSGSYSPVYMHASEFRTSIGGLPGSFFLETVILAGAFTMDWFLNSFGFTEKEETFREEAGAVRPGAGGLMLVPYWNTAMNPYWDSFARGITIGWSPSHTPAHFYRAILEGTAFEQRLHTDGVEKALTAGGGEPITHYVVSGGGAANTLWLKIIADITGRSVERSGVTEAGALGAGILAAAGGGMYPDVKSAVLAMSRRGNSVIVPDPGNHELYDRLYREVYMGLYPALSEGMKRLVSLTDHSFTGNYSTDQEG